MISRNVVLVSALVVLLAGCAPPPTPDPDTTDPSPPGTVDTDDCLVGTWALDVPAYAAESEAYVIGVAPIVDFAMDGAGQLTFTADGLVSTDVSLRTTGTIVAGDVRVPLDVPSSYSATGDWSRVGDDSIQFDNWAKLTGSAEEPSEVDIPSFDYTQLTDVNAFCSATELFIQGPDAPILATWVRG